MVIGYEWISCLEELEFGGICREDFTEGANLSSSKTFGFEDFIGDQDTIFVLAGIEHSHAQFIDIVIGGESMAIGIDKRQARFVRRG